MKSPKPKVASLRKSKKTVQKPNRCFLVSYRAELTNNGHLFGEFGCMMPNGQYIKRTELLEFIEKNIPHETVSVQIICITEMTESDYDQFIEGTETIK